MRVDAAGGQPKLERQLTLFDSVMIVISGTIGASIFIVPADVLKAVPNPAIALLLWIGVGGITLMAGLACAELGRHVPGSRRPIRVHSRSLRPLRFVPVWVGAVHRRQ